MDRLQLIYLFLYWQTFGLFPVWGYTNKVVKMFVYNCLYRHILSFLMCKRPGVKWLEHMVSTCITFQEMVNYSTKEVVSIYIPISSLWEFQFYHVFATFGMAVFFIVITLMCMFCGIYLTVISFALPCFHMPICHLVKYMLKYSVHFQQGV